jgi:hypothetical protein
VPDLVEEQNVALAAERRTRTDPFEQSDRTMTEHDPDVSPAPTDWLQADEGERIDSVSADHRRNAGV